MCMVSPFPGMDIPLLFLYDHFHKLFDSCKLSWLWGFFFLTLLMHYSEDTRGLAVVVNQDTMLDAMDQKQFLCLNLYYVNLVAGG